VVAKLRTIIRQHIDAKTGGDDDDDADDVNIDGADETRGLLAMLMTKTTFGHYGEAGKKETY
jgi:hypothetical protein